MSELIEQDTEGLAALLKELLDSIMSAADRLRTEILAHKLDPRSGMRGELPGNLIIDIYALKDNHYLACCYRLDLLFPPIFSNKRVLDCVDAWLLKYHNQQAGWSVEAFSFIDGGKKFTRMVQPFRPDWLKGYSVLTPVMTFDRAGTARAVIARGRKVITGEQNAHQRYHPEDPSGRSRLPAAGNKNTPGTAWLSGQLQG